MTPETRAALTRTFWRALDPDRDGAPEDDLSAPVADKRTFPAGELIDRREADLLLEELTAIVEATFRDVVRDIAPDIAHADRWTVKRRVQTAIDAALAALAAHGESDVMTGRSDG